ncbi:hypothetical protein JCM11251_005587 [Rhodosporidiobolus azoricus]
MQDQRPLPTAVADVRLPTILPGHPLELHDQHGVLHTVGNRHERLEPPHRATANLARQAISRRYGDIRDAMVSAAILGSLKRVFGESFTSAAAQAYTARLSMLGLPHIIRSFVRYIIPALYAERPDDYRQMHQAVAAYNVNPAFLLVTRLAARVSNYSDMYVPAIAAPVAPKPSGQSYALRLRGTPTQRSPMPAPLEVYDHEVTTHTQGLIDLRSGVWSINHQPYSVDSQAVNNPALAQPAELVTWRYTGMECVPGRPDQLAAVIWELKVTWLDGQTQRLRVHFDLRVSRLQHEFETEYALGRVNTSNGTALIVRGRRRDERGVVLRRQQQGR